MVFTLPAALRPLTLGNRKKLFDLLFAAAAKTLKGTLAQEHQMQFSSLMVLRTWNSNSGGPVMLNALALKESYSYSGASRYSYSYSKRGTNDRTNLRPRPT